MSVTQLEPWKDKVGIAEFFACSISQIEKWTRMGMPSRIMAGKRKYRPTECQPWVDRYEEAKQGKAA